MSWKYCLGTNTFSRDTLGEKGKSRSIRERWWWGVAMEKPLLVTKWPWSLGKCGPRRNLPFSRPKGRARGGKKSDSREAGQRRILDQGLRPQFHTPLYCWIYLDLSFFICKMDTMSPQLLRLWFSTSHDLCCCQGLLWEDRGPQALPTQPLAKAPFCRPLSSSMRPV